LSGSPSPGLGDLRGTSRALLGRLVQSTLELAGHLSGVLKPVDLGAAPFAVRKNGLDRAPVLALQAVNRVQTLLDQLQAAGLGLDSLQVAAKRARGIAQLE
jgi:hypothetical protein